jgi:hypothetical protein
MFTKLICSTSKQLSFQVVQFANTTFFKHVNIKHEYFMLFMYVDNCIILDQSFSPITAQMKDQNQHEVV